MSKIYKYAEKKCPMNLTYMNNNIDNSVNNYKDGTSFFFYFLWSICTHNIVEETRHSHSS